MESSFQNENKSEIGGKMIDLIKDRIHRRNLIIFIVQWVAGVYAYYNMYFQLKYFKGDIFTYVINAGISEMISNIIAGLIF